jgi:hypothetical protein
LIDPPKLTNAWKLQVDHRKLKEEAQKLIDEVQLEEKNEKEERKRIAALKIRARIDKKYLVAQKDKAESKKKMYEEGL